MMDVPFIDHGQWRHGRPPARAAPRALPPRLDARGRRRARPDTSTVSQQLAALARDVGVPLLEPVGRRVRLTAAGRRLADHAVTILAAVETARRDLDPEAEPAGTIRVAAFGSAVRRALVPLVTELASSYPQVALHLSEHEPLEAFELLAADDVDLALVYDYTLAPAAWPGRLTVRPLWTVPWGLAVPAGGPAPDRARRPRSSRRSPTGPGSPTPATPPTRRRCARWPRWPASRRASSTASTASSWSPSLIRGGLGVGLLAQEHADEDGVDDPAAARPAGDPAGVRRGARGSGGLAAVAAGARAPGRPAS